MTSNKIYYLAIRIVDYLDSINTIKLTSTERFIEIRNLVEEIEARIKGEENCISQYITRLEEEAKYDRNALLLKSELLDVN